MIDRDRYGLAGVDPETAAGAILAGNVVLIEFLAGALLAQYPDPLARLIVGMVEAEMTPAVRGLAGHPDVDATRRREVATATFVSRVLQAALVRAAILRGKDGRG